MVVTLPKTFKTKILGTTYFLMKLLKMYYSPLMNARCSFASSKVKDRSLYLNSNQTTIEVKFLRHFQQAISEVQKVQMEMKKYKNCRNLM